MTKEPVRSFSWDFKLRTLERLQAGETVSALAREIGVHRQLIYKWKDAARAGSRRRGRPTKIEALARQSGDGGMDALAAARRRIAELERKVGQQAVELDFFQGALRRIKASRQRSE